MGTISPKGYNADLSISPAWQFPFYSTWPAKEKKKKTPIKMWPSVQEKAQLPFPQSQAIQEKPLFLARATEVSQKDPGNLGLLPWQLLTVPEPEDVLVLWVDEMEWLNNIVYSLCVVLLSGAVRTNPNTKQGTAEETQLQQEQEAPEGSFWQRRCLEGAKKATVGLHHFSILLCSCVTCLWSLAILNV